MRPKTRRERQRLFAFMYKKKPKLRIQPLIGKTWNRREFDRLFELNGKMLAQSSTQNTITFHELPQGRRRKIKFIASGTLEKIGRTEFTREYLLKKTAEIGYGIEKKYRRKEYLNKGIATALVKALIEKAKAEGYEKLTAEVMPQSKASQRILEKLGFQNGRFVITEGAHKGAQVWYKHI